MIFVKWFEFRNKKLRRDGVKTQFFSIPIQIRYVPYKQGISHYYLPEVFIKNGIIFAHFYRKQGHKKVKHLKESWQLKSQSRAQEFKRIMEENGWNKADLARHLGVSRAWVTMVMRELEE